MRALKKARSGLSPTKDRSRVSCVSALEFGAPVSSMSEYGYSPTTLWALLIRCEGHLLPEFGSFVRGEAIAKKSDLRLKGARRSDLKIIASDPELTAIAKDIETLNDA